MYLAGELLTESRESCPAANSKLLRGEVRPACFNHPDCLFPARFLTVSMSCSASCSPSSCSSSAPGHRTVKVLPIQPGIGMEWGGIEACPCLACPDIRGFSVCFGCLGRLAQAIARACGSGCEATVRGGCTIRHLPRVGRCLLFNYLTLHAAIIVCTPLARLSQRHHHFTRTAR